MIRLYNAMIEGAATGAWATPARLGAYPAILIAAYVIAGVGLVMTGQGDVDFAGRPIGADFGMMWSAGQTALAGRPEDVFSLPAQAAAQREWFGEGAGFTPWLYPPTFLFPATGLATLPYLMALAVWVGATFALYLIAIRACVGGQRKFVVSTLLLAAAFPAVLINAAHGQNGFLTTSLMTGGVLALRTRPIAAGALFALMSYKPQFCVMIPFLLLARGDWRAISSAAISGSVILGAAWLAFGARAFQAFLALTPDAKRLTIDTGATGWNKIQSVYAGLRLLGADYDAAMLAQIVVAALVITAVVLIWRSRADVRLRQALALAGVLLTTPYCVDYDMMLLAPALALLALYGFERGFARWEITLLALVFVTPLMARLAGGALNAPLGLIVMLGFFAWTLRRAIADARATPIAKLRTSPGPPLPSAS